MKELTIEITNRCSLNCIQCSTKATDKGHFFLKEDRLKEYLKKFQDYDVVRLSGGEPFEHPHIDKICSEIHGQNKKVNILSCGVYYNESIPYRFLNNIKKDVDEITFSYHGYENVHEKIAGVKRPTGKNMFWENLCDSMDNATLARIPYSFETVLMRENLPRIEETAKNIYGFGIGKSWNGFGDERLHWHILRFVKQGRGKVNSDQALTKEEMDKFPGMVGELRKRYPTLDITYTNSFDQKECDCGSKKAVITCTGEIIPCSALKYGAKKGKFACMDRI